MLAIPPAADIPPATYRKESPPLLPATRPAAVRPRGKYIISKDIERVLTEACKKLAEVERERYIWQQRARIEGCLNGKSLLELNNMEWYHFSGYPKKYV